VSSKAEYSNFLPYKTDYSDGQKWSPQTGWIVFSVVSFLCQLGVLCFAATLIHKPFTFPPNPFRIPTPGYNTLITALGSILKALNLVAWTNLGAGYLVKRLSDPNRKFTYRFYDRGVYLATGSIHWQASWTFAVSLLLFASFTLYAAAFTAAFGLHPLTQFYSTGNIASNISANILPLNGSALPNFSGNDFEINLLSIPANNYTAGQPVTLTVDGYEMDVTDGLVLGVEVQVTAFAASLENSNTNAHIAHILYDTYGSATLSFNATGVQATTSCMMGGQPSLEQSQTVADTYTIFNLSSPTCGQQTRVHDITSLVVYDAYSCINGSSIVTGIIRTNPSEGTLDDAIECYTTLQDTFGAGTFDQNVRVTEPGAVFESTPMVTNGLLGVQAFTDVNWIQMIGRTGSQGLRKLIYPSPLDSSTRRAPLQEAISCIYAVGGSKIIDAINFGHLDNSNSRSIVVYASVQIFQLGYGMVGWQRVWILIFVLNTLMALASTILMWWFPIMPLNPIKPLSMALLSLNSPQSPLLNGTSVGRLPELSILQKLRGILCMRPEGDPGNAYKDLEFHLEVNNNHLQISTYGNRDGDENAGQGTLGPTMGNTYF
jgi:hypothetical protein